MPAEQFASVRLIDFLVGMQTAIAFAYFCAGH
jgi:hypothetical protein